MSNRSDDAIEVLRAVWDASGQSHADLDEAFGPTKSCKNMKHVSFDAMSEPGTDLRESWRQRLAREGKLNRSGQTIRDLILGPDTDDTDH